MFRFRFVRRALIHSLVSGLVPIVSAAAVLAAPTVVLEESFDDALPTGDFDGRPHPREGKLEQTDAPGWTYFVGQNAGDRCGITANLGDRQVLRGEAGKAGKGEEFRLLCPLPRPVDPERQAVSIEAVFSPLRRVNLPHGKSPDFWKGLCHVGVMKKDAKNISNQQTIMFDCNQADQRGIARFNVNDQYGPAGRPVLESDLGKRFRVRARFQAVDGKTEIEYVVTALDPEPSVLASGKMALPSVAAGPFDTVRVEMFREYVGWVDEVKIGVE